MVFARIGNGDVVYRLPPFRVRHRVGALAETIDWSLRATGIPQLWMRTRGRGVRLAVLDTGIDRQHSDLRDAVVATRDFTRSWVGADDRQGHGTHVAGTIAARENRRGVIGVAPQCELIVGKVLDDSGSGSDRAVAAGIVWAVDAGAEVISMSLGSPQPSRRIGDAIERAAAAGVLVICAAGNDGRPDSVNYPARRRATIAVAATNRRGEAAEFSSRGDQIDIAAPGVDILSTWPGGRYARLSGTSMATPFVAGVVALLLAAEKQQGRNRQPRTVDWLRELLARTATDAGRVGKDPVYGWGLIHPKAMLPTRPNEADTSAGELPTLRIDVTANGAPAVLVLEHRPA